MRAHELRRTAEWVTHHIPSLDPGPLRAGTCLAALPEDENRQFCPGRADGPTPDGERITVAAGGRAFTFVPVFGEIAVDLMVHGRTDHDVAALGLQPAESHAPLPDTKQNRPSGEMTR
ncbi:hypothetical protein AB0D04_33895 [Streptomyces sp. NPDC048483]|uniref:hypothetical protein n=1 Tax=Streptomyces sp. NPDC048483 TaxID=3154927 RepID=UPI0034373E31